MQHKDFLKKLLFLAIPIVLQNLVASSLHIIDTLMIGNLGEVYYAGVTQANRYTFVYQLFMFGAASGSGIFLSQFFGSNDLKAMKMVQGLCLKICLGIAFLFAGVALLFPKGVMSLFLQPGDSLNYGAQYLSIVAVGYLVSALDTTMTTAMKSAQKTIVPMVAGICAILCNTVLNYALIYGHFGFPAMGVQGAAVATVIAATLSLCINVGVSYLKRYPSALKLRDLRNPPRAFTAAFFKRITPVIFNEGLWAMGMTMYGIFYGKLGDGAVSAIGIYQTVDQLMCTMIYGLMTASSIIVGNTLGKGDKDTAYVYAKRLLAIATGLGVVMGIVVIFARFPLTNLFNISNETKQLTQTILLYSSFFIWVRAFNTINIVGVLRSGGDTIFTMLLDSCSAWFVGVPMVGIAALLLKWPIQYVYLCSMGEEVLKCLVGIPRLRSKKWMNVLSKGS